MSAPNSKRSAQLFQKVSRWEGHMSEKDDTVRKLPPSLDSLAANGTVEEPAKRRKTLHTKPEDDSTTKACISIANHHSMLSSNESIKLPSKTNLNSVQSTLHERGKMQRIAIRTNLDPIDQLRKELAAGASAPVEKTEENNHAISGTTFGITQLENIFDETRRYWNRRTSHKTDNGIEGYEKEEVSRYHVKKILWAQSNLRPFAACIMGEKGFCRAQVEASLRHPLAPEAPCMAYYSVREYDAVLNGVLADAALAKLEFCEFCYRYQVELEVERIKHSSHRSESEIPHRYYKAGIPGEYSVAGMHQPVEKKTTQYPDGILGHMRKFNTADFIPVVARLDDGEPGETWHVDEYRRLREMGKVLDTEPVLYGWEETGPVHQLNDSALFEVNQIDPYERVTVDTAEELTVASVLRDHFERRATTTHENFVHIFQDLMECVNDPSYAELPHVYSETPEQERWQRFCLHDTTQPFDYSRCSIYTALLIKINTCKEMAYSGRPLRVTDNIKQKLNKYISAHHDLIQWISQTQCWITSCRCCLSTTLVTTITTETKTTIRSSSERQYGDVTIHCRCASAAMYRRRVCELRNHSSSCRTSSSCPQKSPTAICPQPTPHRCARSSSRMSRLCACTITICSGAALTLASCDARCGTDTTDMTGRTRRCARKLSTWPWISCVRTLPERTSSLLIDAHSTGRL
jgi:hypothetical protein